MLGMGILAIAATSLIYTIYVTLVNINEGILLVIARKHKFTRQAKKA